MEINELTVEEFGRLLQAFVQLAEFDVVVVDFDGGLDKEKVVQLQMMDKLIVPFIADEMVLHKIELFVKELKMLNSLRDILHKSQLVLNKANNQSSVECSKVADWCVCRMQ